MTQVVAYDTGFAALTAGGQVWTSGDERYAACLGREVSDERYDENHQKAISKGCCTWCCLADGPCSPAGRPGLVTALEGLPTGPITKIAAGGYLLAALTSGNDLYCWGGHPARRSPIEGVGCDPEPVTVDEQDIVYIGVGNSHAIALTSQGEVFVTGENTNGQLGLDIASTSSWTRVDLGLGQGRTPVGVYAGPLSSLILVQQQHQQHQQQ